MPWHEEFPREVIIAAERDSAAAGTVSVLENTTLGISFIGAAYSSSETGQNPAGLACFQPAVVGVDVGELAAGDAGPAGASGAGLVAVSSVVVTDPSEPPFSQADQDFCQ